MQILKCVWQDPVRNSVLTEDFTYSLQANSWTVLEISQPIPFLYFFLLWDACRYIWPEPLAQVLNEIKKTYLGT